MDDISVELIDAIIETKDAILGLNDTLESQRI
jgi:hypothetical protein